MHCNQRRHDFDLSLLGPSFDDLIEGAIVLWATVRISGTVRLHGADIDLSRINNFRPTYCSRKKMGVAKWNIRDRNLAANILGTWHRNRCIRQSRAANCAQSLVANDHLFPDSQTFADGEKRTSLPFFRPLAVTYMQSRHLIIANCQSGANTRIHAPAQQHNGPRSSSRITHATSVSTA